MTAAPQAPAAPRTEAVNAPEADGPGRCAKSLSVTCYCSTGGPLPHAVGAAGCLACVSAVPPMDHVERLRQEWTAKKTAYEAAQEVARAASRAEAEARLALLVAEGRPATDYDRAWLEAWLAGDFRKCERIRAVDNAREALRQVSP